MVFVTLVLQKLKECVSSSFSAREKVIFLLFDDDLKQLRKSFS